MRALLLIIFLTTSLLGCRTLGDRDSGSATSRTPFDVYRDANKPSRPYREIALLSREGKAQEQSRIEEEFKKDAAKMGGKALIIYPKEQTGEHWTPFYASRHAIFTFEASVIVYQ